jgi:hypothetical protein
MQADSQSEEAIEVLRQVWTSSGQTAEDLEDAFGPQRSCKNMRNVGFDDLAESDGDMRSAWRSALLRDGKLNPRAGSVRDLVLGPAESKR